ncbi:type I-E CRISPR-associated endonuclease Cas1e [Brevibacterium sp.]|uniref:type I-E CRISPR-associated endonuclease Cas1e n=1 Tax=Brevibacterium sp. TaxID=1701 RepID=UPI0028113F34|nr:type I-E CRISPR-associated endonuclease Cas1e [Brevibacterium sp.]
MGAPPPEPTSLGRFRDRSSFLYVERATLHRDANALTVTDQEGTVHVPGAMLTTLLLGPGTRVTHSAMSLLGDCGVTVVWVGEQGVRYYAHGRSMARNSHLLAAQARLVTNKRTRLDVARKMFLHRFPGEDVSSLTMSQLRGREGARVKQIYREQSARTGVSWTRRDYRPGQIASDDFINQALTAANSIMYGIVHAAIVSIGCSPGLGFVHTGTDRAFVYDIADLYKAESVIPTAFEVVAGGSIDPIADVRYALRDSIVKTRILDRIVTDIVELFGIADEAADEVGSGTSDFDDWLSEDVISLWSPRGNSQSGVNYGQGSK